MTQAWLGPRAADQWASILVLSPMFWSGTLVSAVLGDSRLLDLNDSAD